MKLLKSLVLLLAVAALFFGCTSTPDSARSVDAVPKLGLQAYTFRQLSFSETLDRAQALGIQYLQAYPGQRLAPDADGAFHHTMDAATQARVLDLLKSKGVTLVSYGVVNGRDEAEWRQIFGFAKAMGLQNITAEPPESDLKLVARLAREHKIKVAIHNHPAPSRYADPAVALKALRSGRGWLFLSADTGHWARSGFDPVATLRQAKGKIHELHFKDLTETGVKSAHDVPWGTGASNAAGQIAELRRQRFSGIAYVEYEHATPALEKHVERSAAYFRSAVAAPLSDLVADRVSPPGFSNDVAAVWTERQTGYGSPKWPMPRAVFDYTLSQETVTSGSWKADQGVFIPQGPAEVWARGTYKDFVLSLEFRCEEGSEGKVHLRTPQGQPGISVQIRQGDAADDKHLVGAIYGILGPTRQLPIKPGEWNRMVVKAHGQQVVVLLNGEEVTKLNAQAPKPAGPSAATADAPAAPPEPQPVPIPAEGRIGLQSGAKPVQFRNVRIEPLMTIAET
jgi:sugar phosphate isomerase/epimerase